MDVESNPIDELVARLRTRVAQRREAGEYPPELERDLDEHFQRIVAHRRPQVSLDGLRDLFPMLDATMGFDLTKIATDSAVPGGQSLHRAVGKLVARQSEGVLHQVQEFADIVREILRGIVAILEDPYSHAHGDLVGQVDAILERLAGYERGPIDSPAAVGDLRRRVELLEAAERSRQFRPWFSSDRFTDEFRGTRQQLLERYRDLAQHLEGCGPVLEIGCGRGEFLELLAEFGVQASGVELDLELVGRACQRGLDVAQGDGLAVLAGWADESLGGIVLVRTLERFSPQQVVELVAAAAEKLRPGGRVVIETANPGSLSALVNGSHVDPGGTQPLHAAYLAFLFNEAGFSEVSIVWRGASAPDEVLAGDDPDTQRLNRLLFSPQDYALIATR